jgi:hypothetical protein
MINIDVSLLVPGQHRGHIDVDHFARNQHRCRSDAVNGGSITARSVLGAPARKAE